MENKKCLMAKYKEVTMKVYINGKSYNSFDEWVAEERKNPNSETLIWDNITCQMMNGKRIVNGTGKCTYKGKTYEGKIEYDEQGHIYVGGEFVK